MLAVLIAFKIKLFKLLHFAVTAKIALENSL